MSSYYILTTISFVTNIADYYVIWLPGRDRCVVVKPPLYLNEFVLHNYIFSYSLWRKIKYLYMSNIQWLPQQN